MINREKLAFEFYRINDAYIDHLHSIDSKIMTNAQNGKKRSYVGILLEINGHKYCAPLTSYKEEKHSKIKSKDLTCVLITATEKGETKKISLLNLNNMFPVTESQLTFMEFPNEDSKNILEKEYEFLKSNKETVLKKAEKLYNLRLKGNNDYVNKMCCDFKKLEENYLKTPASSTN